nr:hypothetical protein [Tanacetum cinerariifolium]
MLRTTWIKKVTFSSDTRTVMNQQRHIAADWLSMKRACLDLWEKAMEKERKVLMKEQDVIEREKKLP